MKKTSDKDKPNGSSFASPTCLEAVANRHANIAIRAYLRGQYDEFARRIKIADGLRQRAAMGN